MLTPCYYSVLNAGKFIHSSSYSRWPLTILGVVQPNKLKLAKNSLSRQITFFSRKARVAEQKIKSKITRGRDRRIGCCKKRGRGLEQGTNEKQI